MRKSVSIQDRFPGIQQGNYPQNDKLSADNEIFIKEITCELYLKLSQLERLCSKSTALEKHCSFPEAMQPVETFRPTVVVHPATEDIYKIELN